MPNLSEPMTIGAFADMLRDKLIEAFPDENIDDETTFDFVVLLELLNDLAIDHDVYSLNTAIAANEKRRSALKMKRKAQKKRRRK